MNDYYTTLGVSENATQEEIKKAYKRLANKHHPDKGGDESIFKDISAAYDTIGDQAKRQEYDMQRKFGDNSQFNHYQNSFNGGANFEDIFSHFGFDPFNGMFNRRPQQRNRDLNLECVITLLESFTGKKLEAKFTLPSGKKQNVIIDIPAGVENGNTINYPGLGDDSIIGLTRGNLHVTIYVNSDPNFERRGDDLYSNVEINPIEAIIGCKKKVISITGETSFLDIRPGVETGVEYAKNGFGFKNVRTGASGRLVLVIKIKTPKNLDKNIIDQLTEINTKINKL